MAWCCPWLTVTCSVLLAALFKTRTHAPHPPVLVHMQFAGPAAPSTFYTAPSGETIDHVGVFGDLRQRVAYNPQCVVPWPTVVGVLLTWVGFGTTRRPIASCERSLNYSQLMWLSVASHTSSSAHVGVLSLNEFARLSLDAFQGMNSTTRVLNPGLRPATGWQV